MPSLRQSQPQTAVATKKTTPSVRQAIPSRSNRTSRPSREYGPTRVADHAASGVGLLEAEFLGAVAILLLTFISGPGTYGDKVVTLLKRGSFVSILFFVLALIAGTGSNAAKVAKGLGALVLVTTLINSSSGSLFADLDQMFKNISKESSSASASPPASAPPATAPSPAPAASGTSAAQKVTDFLHWLSQQPINSAKGIINDIKGLIP